METTILVGDCLKKLQELPDEIVHCVITSPPYWGLRAYKGDPGMIGLEPTFEEHLENLLAVFREVWRVLREDGTLWLNYGDSYTSGGRKTRDPGKSKLHPAFEGDRYPSGLRPDTPSGLKPKDLLLMPARVAMALRDDGAADVRAMRTIERIGHELADEYRAADEELPGPVRRVLDKLAEEYSQAKGDSWWLRSEIIWHKPNPMPESCQDRPTSSHEKLFLLSKSAKYFYDAEAVRVPSDGWHGKVMPTHAPEHSEGQQSRDSRTPKDIDGRGARLGRAPGWRKNVEQPSGANLRNVWKIAAHSFSEAHFATFPPKLVEPCIKSGTSENGCCAECGAPWVRRTEKRGTGTMTKKPDGWATGDGSHGTVHRDGREAGETMEVTRTVSKGWLPTCEHDADPVPATVLDPFAGAGTVGLVAQRLGRSTVLIEISKEYAEMARERIAKDMPLFSQVELNSSTSIEIDECPGMPEMEDA